MKNIFSFIEGRIRSFGYAFKGIWVLFSTQKNAQVHLLALIIIALWGGYLGLDKMEWCAICICIALVLMAEAMNTAIEFLVDLVSPQYNPLAGKIKDVAAGAVLLCVMVCGVVWAIIFLPKIFP
jgi:diacylglycerol kinase